MADNDIELIRPDWPAPANVTAVSTTRAGGVSQGPYASLNLGTHVGDAPDATERNRTALHDALAIDTAPCWLEQVHGADVVRAEKVVSPVPADAAITDRENTVCVVMTADCLPVLLCDRSGGEVAAVHAGWRGLAAGVVEAAVAGFDAAPDQLLAWLGPAIGAAAYEVGADVVDGLGGDMRALAPNAHGRWQLDLYALAGARLGDAGVAAVYGGGFCTFTDSARFFSYRRDGACGRMATLIWRGR